MGNLLSYVTSSNNRTYGWKRDLHDCRDHIHNFNDNFDSVIDLSPNGPKEIYEYKQNESNKFTPSRLFIYYNEREIEGNINTDSGAEIRDGIKTISKIGVCPETLWPYDITQFTVKPKYECYEMAKHHRSIQYKRVLPTLEQLKSGLSNGFPIVFGFIVYESFESEETAKTGIVKMPEQSEKVLGGHAVTLVGYDDTKGTFKVRNSWSAKWGDKGYCYFPYDYITDSNLCSDFWTVQKINDDE